MPATRECIDEVASEQWFEEMTKIIELSCNACANVWMDVKDLEAKVREAYARTAQSLVGVYDQKVIAGRWFVMMVIAEQILGSAKLQKKMNPVCGVDTQVFETFFEAASELFQLHCPLPLCKAA